MVLLRARQSRLGFVDDGGIPLIVALYRRVSLIECFFGLGSQYEGGGTHHFAIHLV